MNEAPAGEGAAATDAEWLEALGRHLADRIPEVIPGRPGLAALEPLADDVWLARLTDLGRVVVKHQFYGLLTAGRSYDLLQTEVEVLAALRRAGCPVPLAFGADAGAQVIFLEWAGPQTLTAALSGEAPLSEATRSALAGKLLAGLKRIEEALAGEPGWEARLVPGGSREELASAWEMATEGAVEGLSLALGAGSTGPAQVEAATVALRQVAAQLGRRPARLGPTDYQPANVVLDRAGERLTFLEQGKLGWDWTERRAVQYSTPVGEPRRPGLLDPGAARLYGALWPGTEAGERRRALDGHDLVFHLLWARRVIQAGGREAVAGDLARRLVTALSDAPLVGGVRQRLAAALHRSE